MFNGWHWIRAVPRHTAANVLIDTGMPPIWLGCRCAFGNGAMLGLIVIFFRRWIPESPRWLMIHGRNPEAEQIVGEVERKIASIRGGPRSALAATAPPTRIRTRAHTPWSEIWHAIVHEHRR